MQCEVIAQPCNFPLVAVQVGIACQLPNRVFIMIRPLTKNLVNLVSASLQRDGVVIVTL